MKPSVNSNTNASPEIRAFIYQQLTDLEGLLPQGSNVSIVVEDPGILEKNKKAKAKNHKKKVFIQLETSAGNIVVESEHLNVYKAIQVAKEDLRTQLTALQTLLNGEDRDQQIENIIDHKYLH